MARLILSRRCGSEQTSVAGIAAEITEAARGRAEAPILVISMCPQRSSIRDFPVLFLSLGTKPSRTRLWADHSDRDDCRNRQPFRAPAWRVARLPLPFFQVTFVTEAAPGERDDRK